VQRRKIAHICAPFKPYSRERTWTAIGDRLQGPCYLSRDEDDRKIRAREQRRDVGKYSFVNRTSKIWNQLPADTLAFFSRISYIFIKKAKKVVIREVK
jgi:uncharacterized protein YaeQ